MSFNPLEFFEQERPRLTGLAYRILGSYTDAQDIVQETWIRWSEKDYEQVKNPSGWLTTVCTRRCLDELTASHRKRMEYVGPWLPEPIQTTVDPDVAEKLELADSLTMAFLLVLDRLSPKERAAWLLHEVFFYEYSEVAEILDTNEASCRKLVSRAKENLKQGRRRNTISQERQNEFLDAFRKAIGAGEFKELETMLTEDVQLTTDSNGKVYAAKRIVESKESVLKLVERLLHKYWSQCELEVVQLNGSLGMIVRDGETIHAALVPSYNLEQNIESLFIMRNPDKLNAINESPRII